MRDRIAEIQAEMARTHGQARLIELGREKVRLELELLARPPDDPGERLRRFAGEVDGFVGRRLRAARVTAGISQATLARAVCLSQKQLSRAERGVRALTIPELVRVAIQLRRPLDYFIDPPPDADGPSARGGSASPPRRRASPRRAARRPSGCSP